MHIIAVPQFAFATASPGSSPPWRATPQRGNRRAGLPLLLASGPSDEPEEKVTVTRRRPRGEQGAARERAETPERRRDERAPTTPRARDDQGGWQQAPGPTVAGGGAGCNLLGLLLQIFLRGGCLTKLLFILVGLLLLIFVVLPLLMGPEEEPYPLAPTQAPIQQPTQAPVIALPTEARPATPTRAPGAPTATLMPAAPTWTPAAAVKGQKWLVMMYQDADDKVLEQDIFFDVNEAERVGSTDRVQIVAQLDRYRGGFNGDGDWTGTRRYLVTKDNDLNRIGSRVVAELGEVNMADPRTLVDFVTWAMKTYPADRHILIMSDHGMGWPGGFNDADPARSTRSQNIPVVQALGNYMPLHELDAALQQIRSQTGLDRFEMIGLDACLMADLEVLEALAPHARYFVGSQETEPSLGWAYTAFLSGLVANPDVTGAEVGKAIVQSYIAEDQRIVDDNARAQLLGRTAGGMSDLFGVPAQASAQQVARQMSADVTLTAVDLTKVPALTNSLNQFVLALQGADQRVVAQARTYAQSFTSVWGSSVPPSFIDLGHLAQLLKQHANDQAVAVAADRLVAAIKQAVVAEKHGPRKPGATGVSIYFPNSQLYRTAQAGAQSYVPVADRFVQNSLWDEFLAFHYTGRRFDASSVGGSIPQRGVEITAPAAGQITLSPITVSARTVSPGRTITLSTDISGQNVGYVYLFAGFLDQKSNSIFLADMDYLQSPTTRQLQGVYYPDWGTSGRFRLQFAWEPIVYAITDGTINAVAMLKPEQYGASGEEAVYSVEGIYTYADGRGSTRARLYFANGVLIRVLGFAGDSADAGVGALREIVPQVGDTVTILEQWLDIGAAGQPSQMASQRGNTLKFGSSTLKWKEMDAAAGEYVVGFIVEDLDGNRYQVNTTITVR